MTCCSPYPLHMALLLGSCVPCVLSMHRDFGLTVERRSDNDGLHCETRVGILRDKSGRREFHTVSTRTFDVKIEECNSIQRFSFHYTIPTGWVMVPLSFDPQRTDRYRSPRFYKESQKELQTLVGTPKGSISRIVRTNPDNSEPRVYRPAYGQVKDHIRDTPAGPIVWADKGVDTKLDFLRDGFKIRDLVKYRVSNDLKSWRDTPYVKLPELRGHRSITVRKRGNRDFEEFKHALMEFFMFNHRYEEPDKKPLR